MKRAIAAGVSTIGVLLLAGCSSSPPPVPPAPTQAVAVAPSTAVISDSGVDSRGFERNTEAENELIYFASLGDGPGAVPDAGAQSFPSYAKEAGATLPTADYALNLMYWGCEQAKANPSEAANIDDLAVALSAGLSEVTGYVEGSRQAVVYTELMSRGMEKLCPSELEKYEGYAPTGGLTR